jgi:hypothetical protein
MGTLQEVLVAYVPGEYMRMLLLMMMMTMMMVMQIDDVVVMEIMALKVVMASMCSQEIPLILLGPSLDGCRYLQIEFGLEVPFSSRNA